MLAAETVTAACARPLVLLVGAGAGWTDELSELARSAGYDVSLRPSLAAAVVDLRRRTIHALVVDGTTLGPSDVVTLRHCRAVSPSTLLVAVAAARVPRGLQRALESGATTFIAWPAAQEVIDRALHGH